jgi:8-oxo-dGTP pyrophosphatase MutT (NUDIX family)
MFEARILYKGQFQLEDIQTDILDDEWVPTPDYDERVKEAWNLKLTEAQEKDMVIWDGTYYRVTNITELENTSDSIVLRLGTVPYRYIGTLSKLKEHYLASGFPSLNHLSTAAIIHTNDDYYMFGKRTNDGTIDLIGGGVQKDEVEVTSGSDLTKNLYKEIEEESGIKKSDIKEMNGIGILFSITSNTLIIGHIEVNLSKQEVEEVFKHRGDNEMAEPVFVPKDKLAEFLWGMKSYRALIPSLMDIQ